MDYEYEYREYLKRNGFDSSYSYMYGYLPPVYEDENVEIRYDGCKCGRYAFSYKYKNVDEWLSNGTLLFNEPITNAETLQKVFDVFGIDRAISKMRED